MYWIFGALFGPVLVAAFLQTMPAPAQEFLPRPPAIEELPAGVGREEVYYNCTACHGLDIIKQQALTQQGWEGTVTYMIETHGMQPPRDVDRDLIVNYLAKAFPAAPAAAPAYTNPFLSK